MRTLFLILCIFLCGTAGFSQVQSSPYIQPNFAAAYDLDVKHLTVDWLFKTHSPDTALIDISAADQLPIMQALAAIFNTGSTLKADSIFSNYCLHTDTAMLVGHYVLDVSIDTNFAWTHNWRNHQVTTGLSLLDQLLSHYGFYVYGVFSVANYPQVYIKLRTPQFLNISALADSIKSTPGILGAWPYGYGFAGPPDAFYIFDGGNGSHYFKIIAGGGFTASQRWEYNVSPTWFVDSLAIVGSSQFYGPLPNCGLHPLSIKSPATPPAVSISPNPATTSISFQAWHYAYQYRIIDMLGRIVAEGNVMAPVNVVNISSLSPATYNLQLLKTEGGTVSQLFTKQ